MKRFGSQTVPSSWRFRGWLFLLTLFSLALRLIHIHWLSEALGDTQIHDAAYYHEMALARESGAGGGDGVPFANQGYILFLQSFYRVFGSEISAVLNLQAVLGSISVFLVGLSARRLFGLDAVGLLAAALLATYVPSIHFDALLLTPSLSLLLSALGVYAFARTFENGKLILLWAMVVGLSIGFSSALRPSQLLLLPFCGLFLIWPALILTWRRTFSVGLVIVTGVALGLSPLLMEQKSRVGEWVPASANAGMNFWTGNHTGASGTYQVSPFGPLPSTQEFEHTIPLERDAFLAEARKRTEDPNLSLRASSWFWLGEAVREIAHDPLSWLKLMGRKGQVLMNHHEPRTNADLALMKSISPVLGWNPVNFGALLFLSALGVVLRRSSDVRILSALLPFVLAPFLTCLLFFVSAEYRNPAAPSLAILGGFGLFRVLTFRRDEPVRIRSVWAKCFAGFALVAVALLAYWPAEARSDAKDRRVYAGALATVGIDGSKPRAMDYARARALLSEPSVSEDPMVMTSALLVESNYAIQFRDQEAALNFIRINQKLWQLDDSALELLGPYLFNRMRESQMIRAAQLCAQPTIRSWKEIHDQLQLMGCQSWNHIGRSLQKGDKRSARLLLMRSESVAPYAVEILAYRGWLEKLNGNDPVPWLERSFKGYPRIGLSALLLARHYLGEEDWFKARQFATVAIGRAPGNRTLVLEARRIQNASPWSRAGQSPGELEELRELLK